MTWKCYDRGLEIQMSAAEIKSTDEKYCISGKFLLFLELHNFPRSANVGGVIESLPLEE